MGSWLDNIGCFEVLIEISHVGKHWGKWKKEKWRAFTISVILVIECYVIGRNLRQVYEGCTPKAYVLWIGLRAPQKYLCSTFG